MDNIWKRHLRLTKSARHAHTIDMLESVGLSDPARVASSYPHQLSGGMAQRVIIAIAMGTNPQLIIADEATTGLDATVQADILALLDQKISEARASVLFITHDLSLVRRFCDRVIVMHAGRIVEEANTDDFFSNPAHPYSVALLSALHGPPQLAKAFAAGEVPPDPEALPSGCIYRLRCPLAEEICRVTPPPLYDVEASHKSRCHRIAELQARLGKEAAFARRA
jgi:oligopeptide/dipeptide ABC transporter ATP-binding protein